jgi:hypothetical protein
MDSWNQGRKNVGRMYAREAAFVEKIEQFAFETSELSNTDAEGIKTLLFNIFGVKSSSVVNKDVSPKVVYHGIYFDYFDMIIKNVSITLGIQVSFGC